MIHSRLRNDLCHDAMSDPAMIKITRKGVADHGLPELQCLE